MSPPGVWVHAAKSHGARYPKTAAFLLVRMCECAHSKARADTTTDAVCTALCVVGIVDCWMAHLNYKQLYVVPQTNRRANSHIRSLQGIPGCFETFKRDCNINQDKRDQPVRHGLVRW